MSTPHDALFKYVFSQPEHAASELKAVLPTALAERLDWNSLELQPASFVDERLNGRQADLLFTVDCAGREAYLYVLLEHQSTSDPLMAFRLLRYLVRIWEAFLASNPGATRLPAIIPVVVHHSDTGWTAAQDLSSVLDLDTQTLALVGQYVPQFRFVLDDLSDVQAKALRGRSMTAAGTAGLMLLSRARSAPDLMAEMSRFLDVFRQVASAKNGLEALSAYLQYAFEVGDVQPDDLRSFAHQIGPVAEEAFMTAAQILTKQSFAEGKTEGIEQGHAEGKVEGKVEGLAEGALVGRAKLILRQLGLRFGSLSELNQAKVQQASAEQLDLWAEQVLTAKSLQEVLG